jgi:peptidoglycan/xylan/chitin deacetylase (PgdA/CDA1 family)
MRWIYSKIRKFLPVKWRGFLTSILYKFNLKPKVNSRVKSPFEKGIIVISADFEMAWAFRYSKTRGKMAEQMGLIERQNIPKLLSIFEKHNIQVTWATVGHLFLDSCEKVARRIPHPNMPRPQFFENINWKYSTGDWYQHDPCKSYIESPAWYAPDLIDQIIKSPVGHEIGCHTFSHIDCTKENCSAGLLNSELLQCIDLAEKKSLKLKSMVFPGGTCGNFEILKNNNFTCYRVPMNNHIDLPYIDKYGLVAIPSSLCMEKDNYGRSKDSHLKIIRAFLKKTIKHKLVCHFWFHPSMDNWYLENIMPDIFKIIEELRDEGKLTVMTMGDLAENFLHISNTDGLKDA